MSDAFRQAVYADLDDGADFTDALARAAWTVVKLSPYSYDVGSEPWWDYVERSLRSLAADLAPRTRAELGVAVRSMERALFRPDAEPPALPAADRFREFRGAPFDPESE